MHSLCHFAQSEEFIDWLITNIRAKKSKSNRFEAHNLHG